MPFLIKGHSLMNNALTFFLFLFCITSRFCPTTQVSKSEFYVIGSADGSQTTYDQLPTEIDDTSSIEIELKTPIVYFGNVYKSIFVNTNGLVSFVTEIPSFYNIQFPLDYPVIAVLYSDVDTRGHGVIKYGEIDDPTSLSDMNQGIHMHFSFAQDFRAKSAFIVTWDEVGYYNTKSDKLNSFQLVLVSDGQLSFAYMLYASNFIQWIQSEGKSTGLGLPDAKAQAGFMSGDGRMFVLHGSGTDHVRNLDKLSNIGSPGVWLFHLGKLFPGQNVGVPDTNVGSSDFTEFQTCLQGSALCHTEARCIDYSLGFCCECGSGYYGNGQNCLQNDVPQRINGIVTGVLNGVEITDADLHSYVVTSEGRQYTAVSRIQEMVGFDMQLLISLGSVVGWMFALPQGKAKNGFQQTGGIFNSSTEIQFVQTGHSVTIRQNFIGTDAFNYLRVKTEIKGTVPVVKGGSQLAVDDFTEEFNQIQPGMIRSQTKHVFKFEGQGNPEIPFKMSTLLTFDSCEHSPKDIEMDTLRVLNSRMFYMYDNREQIVRYGSSNKISTLGGDDPCIEGRKKCGPNSSCMVEGVSFRCVCNPGYQFYYDSSSAASQSEDDFSATCVDINECSTGQHNCHRFANCQNELGSFRCLCEIGYQGDGVNCERSQSCAELNCGANAECVSLGRQQLECRCKSGFHGDGYDCSPIGQEQDCSVFNYCDPNADCLPDPSGRHYCLCKRGFRGDGVICVEDDDNSAVSCNVLNTCHPHAQCAFDTAEGTHVCRCNSGYKGDGYTCVATDVSCDEAHICSVDAQCVYLEAGQKPVCVCNAGYEGDGIDCNPTDECDVADSCGANAQCIYDQLAQRFTCVCDVGYIKDSSRKVCTRGDGEATCDVLNNCHPHASCSYEPAVSKYTCHCSPGYKGDGYHCNLESSCDVLNNCDVNAECLQDPAVTTYASYKCQCRDGFVGDGLNCIAGRVCDNDPYDCDPNADCVPLANSHFFVCQCLPGFVGDGATCAEAPKFEGNFLLASQGMSIVRLPLQAARGDHGKPVIMQPTQMVVGIDVDCGAGHVYWSDVSGKSIKRASYDGSNSEVFINDDVESPEGIAVDWIGRNIFWTDSLKDTIEVARLDVPSRDRKVIIDSGLVNPRGIAVYPARGLLFWTDWNRTGPKLESANMDGTGRTVLIDNNIELPNSLTVDSERDEICWADAGTKRIECVHIQGHNRRTIISAISYPFGLSNNRENFYWTDWESRKIEVVSKVGGQLQSPLEPPLGGGGKLYGVVAVPERCPRATNACGVQNGGCRHLCLPNNERGRTCACPEYTSDGTAPVCNEAGA